MKSKNSIHKKNSNRSNGNELDERQGLKPVKAKSGKSNRKLSIYDDYDENELDDFKYEDIDFSYDDEYEEEDDY